MDSSPPGSSVHGILQARILEWVVIPYSREQVGCHLKNEKSEFGELGMPARHLHLYLEM